jgi:hypothetical protein
MGILGSGRGPTQSFWTAVLFLLVFPILPLVFELMLTGRIGTPSVALVAFTYAVSLAMSSRNLLIWAIGMFVGFSFATVFGNSMELAAHMRDGWLPGPEARRQTIFFWASWVGIALVFVLHVIERYDRHIVDRNPFPEFMPKEE